MSVAVRYPVSPFNRACVLDNQIILSIIDKNLYASSEKKLYFADLVGDKIDVQVVVNWF